MSNFVLVACILLTSARFSLSEKDVTKLQIGVKVSEIVSDRVRLVELCLVKHGT